MSSQPTAYVAIEVKRRATLESLEQLSRYLKWLNDDPYLPGGVRGILVAQVVPLQVQREAEQRGIKAIEVDYDELRGLEQKDLRLF